MIYRFLADVTVLTHFAFILFVIFGGLLALRWPRAAWAHLPVVAYGALIEFVGWVCPLTPLEKWFRQMGGESTYADSFTEHYIMPVVYPPGLSETVTTTLGISLLLLTILVYSLAIWLHRRRQKKTAGISR